MRIGIDLDNTIIDYDRAFLKAAQQQGLMQADFTGTKQQIRDHIRTLAEGETSWQKLQGYVYGKGIHEAALYPGVKQFLDAAKEHELFIISHKTEFGHYDESKTNLRDAALAFLKTQGVLGIIPREQVFFDATRAGKVNKIATLSLDWFIDDLVEVYEETHFPGNVQKLLFHTASTPAPTGNWTVCGSWNDITTKIFA